MADGAGGNSLINDPKVAGDKAFNWQNEFPQVFGAMEVEAELVETLPTEPDYLALLQTDAKQAAEAAIQAIALSNEAIALSEKAAALSLKVIEYAQKLQTVSEPLPFYGVNKGGFDVVIGNPPYVRLETIKEMSDALSQMNYKTFEKRGDLYCLFVERGFEILKKGGLISFIMPNKWMQAGYGKPLREFILEHELIQLIDFGDIQIFEGATTYPCIFISRKSSPKNEVTVSVLSEVNIDDFYANVLQTAEVFEISKFSGETWVISSKNDQQLLEKLNKSFKTLAEFVGGEAYYGIKTGLTEAFLIDENTKNKITKEDIKSNTLIKPVLRGRDIQPWYGIADERYLITTFPTLNIDIEAYRGINNHLISFGKERLEQSGNNGSRKKTSNKWFETQDPIAYYSVFSKPKIMYQKFQVKPCFIFDNKGLYCI